MDAGEALGGGARAFLEGGGEGEGCADEEHEERGEVHGEFFLGVSLEEFGIWGSGREVRVGFKGSRRKVDIHAWVRSSALHI